MIKRSFLYILNLLRKESESNEPGKYVVFVDDNFHYLDENERYNADGFDTYEEAVEYCKKLVKKLLFHYRAGMTAESLYDLYKDFGEDSFIRTDDEIENKFSARDYAKEKSKEICKIEDIKKGDFQMEEIIRTPIDYQYDYSSLDDLFRRSKRIKNSKEYIKLIEFVNKFRRYAPFNNLLIYLQNPQTTYYSMIVVQMLPIHSSSGETVSLGTYLEMSNFSQSFNKKGVGGT